MLLPSARRFFAPTPFQSHSSQHGGLTGAGGRTPRGIWLHQGNSINPSAYGCSESRFLRSEDTHPCRSCFCRGAHPSICVPRAPPMSGRRWQDSVWNCHQASVHRELTDKHPVLPFRFLENGILAKGETRLLNQILLTYVPRIESPVSQPDRLPQAAVNASTVCFSSRRQIQCPLSPGNMPPRQADREA